MKLKNVSKSQRILILIVFTIVSSIGMTTIIGAVAHFLLFPVNRNPFGDVIVIGFLAALLSIGAVFVEKLSPLMGNLNRNDEKKPPTP